MTDNEPCQTCDSPVVIVEKPGPRRLADKQTPMHESRVCTNRECPSKGPRGHAYRV